MTQVESPASKPVMFQSLRKILAVSIGKLTTLRITFTEGLVHVWALCGLAVSQPLYDRYSRRPVFFEIEGIQTAGLIGLAVMLSLVIPACVMVIELLFARCRPGVQMGVHLAVVGILNVCFALVMAQYFAGSHLAPIAVLGIGLPVGVVLSALYVGVSRWRMLLSYAAWENVLFPVFFLYQVTYGNPLSTTDARLSRRIEIAKPTPIVLIVFDEISGVSLWNRERGLDERIVPHFAKLAAEGVWYRNATSVHPRTAQALPAILTGEIPNNKYEPQISRYPLNLFTLLIGSRDYSVTAFEPYSFLYPSDFDREKTTAPGVGVQFVRAARSLPSVFAHTAIPRVVDLPALPPAWVGISSDHEKMVVKHFGKLRFDWSSRRGMQMDHFLECLGSRSDVEGASKRTPCFFQHLAMPHIPWCYYPNGAAYLKDTGEEFHPTGGLGSLHEIWCGDPLAVETAKFRYWMQLAAADRYVGRMLQKLKDAGLYDQSLVIVMGDHGVSFQPNHSRRQLHPDFSEDILSVPLLVKYPAGLERAPKGGTIDDGNVEILDILPTIADLIGMKLPTKPAGSSLLSVEGRRSVKRFDNDGEVLEFPADAIGRLEEQPSRWRLGGETKQRFPGDYFQMGPHEEIVGKKLEELTVGTESECCFIPDRIVLKRSDQPDAVRPGYIRGAIVGRAGSSQKAQLALVLNGRVRGTTRTIEGIDVAGHVSAFLNPDDYLMGENSFQMFEIREGESGVSLHECQRKVSDDGRANGG